jgi:hypothetical protein
MFFTQNPIGSSATEDLQDNAISFDYAMNSPAALWQDRFGKQHKTVQQALKDVGFKPAGFDFVSGGTLGIGDRDKCVFYPTDGYWYSWNGKLPYVVHANSSPTPGGRKGWGVVVKEVFLAEDLKKPGGSNLVGFSLETTYDPGTIGFRLANAIYVTDHPFNAKCDGVTDDSVAIQSAIDFAVANGKICIQPGMSYITRTIVAKGTYIGLGENISGLVSNEDIYAVVTSYSPATVKFGNMTIKSTTTNQLEVKFRGFDTTGQSPHFAVMENISFTYLRQAIKIDPYFYSNTFNNINVFCCGTETEWAIEYVPSGRVDGANNTIWNQLSITSVTEWPSKGLKVSDGWGVQFNQLHLEHLGEYAAEIGGRAVTINGGYIEQHDTLGTGMYTSNKVKITSNDVSFNGVIINSQIEASALGTSGSYFNCSFIDGGFIPLGAKLHHPNIAGNRLAKIISHYDISNLVQISRNNPVNIPFLSRKGPLKINGNFSGLSEKPWLEGELGETRFNGGNFSLATKVGGGLYNDVGLKIKPDGSIVCAALWYFSPKIFMATGQATVNKMTAWAIVKVVSSSKSLQLSFGLGGAAFQNPEKLTPTGSEGAYDWALLIVDDVSPHSNFVTFNLNRVGGGNPPAGDNEYVLIDSFGVCLNGTDYRNMVGIDNI